MEDPGRNRNRVFALLVDTAAMKHLFQEQLPEFSESGLTIDSCKILHARDKTKLKLTSYERSTLAVCYELFVREPGSEDGYIQILYAKAFLGGHSQVEYNQFLDRSLAKLTCRQAVTHLPDLDVIIWSFPTDPSLPHLPEVMLKDRVVHHFPYDCFPAPFNDPGRLGAVDIKVIHYVGDVRCTAKYQLHTIVKGRSHSLTVYGKTYASGEGKEVYKRIQFFWEMARQAPNGIRVAQPLGYTEEIKTVWQLGMDGTPLHLQIDKSNYRVLLNSVAKGLATLHRAELSSPVMMTIDNQLSEIRKKLLKLLNACRPFQAQLKSIEKDVERMAAELPQVNNRLIHGDFHIRQLLVHDGEILFFDFDECAQGDPMQDLASFIVDLHYYSFDQDLLNRMSRTLIDSYPTHAHCDIHVGRLMWHTTIHCVNKAYRYRFQKKLPFDEELGKMSLALSGRILNTVKELCR